MTLALTGLVWDRPWLLLAAGVMAVLPVLLALRARRGGGRISPLNVAMQCLAVLLAAMALADLSAPFGRGAKPYLVFTDVSDSTRNQRAVLPLPPSLERQSYLFARGAAEGEPPTAPPGFLADRTEITPVLQLSLARAGDIAGVIIHTDGRFQDADWPQLAAQLGARQVPVLLVPMISPPADAAITELAVTRGADGKSAQVRVSVASNAAQRRVLRLWREGRADLLSRALELLPDQPTTIRVDDIVPPGLAVIYRVELSRQDDFPENDRATQVSPPTVRQAAIISRGETLPLDGPFAKDARILAPAQAPPSAEEYLSYSCVLLADATGELLTPTQRDALATYVRQGGGLVIVGAGPHASLADRKDPLNQVAALAPDPFERRPLKLLVLLDASGSMAETIPAGPAGGQVKFAVVSSAVLSLQEHLTPRDALTVYTFSDSPQRIYSSGDAPINFDELRSALAKVRPSGPTRVLPALEQAVAQANLGNRDGMVLLLSDLRTEKIDDVQAWKRRLNQARLSLAVAASPDAAPEGRQFPLEALAREMKAPLVRSRSFVDLAEVFAKLVRQSRPEAIRRGQFAAQAIGEFWFPRGPMPAVNAYILCAPAEGADVLATVGPPGGKDSDALIARRSVGLGRTVSVAISPGENPALQSGQSLSRLLTGAVQWAAAPQGDRRFTAEMSREAGELAVRLQARDEKGPMNLLELTATVQPSEAGAKVISGPLSQVTPGRYEFRTQAPLGPLAIDIRDAAGRTVWRGALAATCGQELSAVGPDQGILDRLAGLTGGRIVPSSQLAGLIDGRTASQRRPLWPLLAAGALALMLLDWVSVKFRRHL
jgi:hypothetical protein